MKRIIFVVIVAILLSAIHVFGQEKPKEEPKVKTATEVAQVKLNELNKAYQDLEKQKYEFLGKYFEQLQKLEQQAQVYQAIIKEEKEKK